MSNKKNHRRGEDRRTETGPRYENPNPGAGCNATHVARGRARWKRRLRRDARRAGAALLNVEPEAHVSPEQVSDDIERKTKII